MFLLCIAQDGNSQPIGNDLLFDLIAQRPALPGNAVNFIFQDSRGFLWLSTNRGLSRYDGSNIKNYIRIGENGITDKTINSIAEDGDGNIWFGTESGLNKLNPYTEKIIQYSEGTGPGTIPYKWCNYLFRDSKKNIWLTTEKGIALYNSHSNQFGNFPITVFGKDDRINKFINKVVEDTDGNFWLSTSYGIKKFNPAIGAYQSFHHVERDGLSRADNVFFSLFIDHEGGIWAGTFSNGLYRYNNKSHDFEKVNLPGINKDRFTINDITEVKVQDHWYFLLITNGGLVSFRYSQEANATDISYSLKDKWLIRSFHDKQGNIWIGSDEGLWKLNANCFVFKWLSLPPSDNKLKVVYHMIPSIERPMEQFYLTTQSGWYNYEVATQKISPFPLPVDKNELLRNINYWSADEQGYWFSSMQGFGYYNVQKHSLLDLSNIVVKASEQKSTGFIVKATATNYWVTMRRSGILVYNIQTGKDTVIFGNKAMANNTYGQAIKDLQKGKDGFIWFTCSNKLYKVNPATYAYTIYTPPPSNKNAAEIKKYPSRILFTASGRLIVCSELCIYEFKNEQLFTIYPATGFSNYAVEKISEDAAHYYWVQTDAGLFKTDSLFSIWEDMNQLPGWKESTLLTDLYTHLPAQILLASDNKIGVLKQAYDNKPSKPLKVLISRIRYGQQEQYLVDAKKQKIICSYKDAIEIELSPVNFIGERDNHILYRLNGWDKDWKELTGSGLVRYEQLPPGEYEFLTKSRNVAGLEGAESSLFFTITPPFYMTWWFIALVILAMALVMYLIYRFRLKKALELERIRTRIATDLHDDIGATLSAISMYSQAVKGQLKSENDQLKKVLDKMGANSREMVTSMSDIVWAINPGNDEGAKLVQRMESFATDICAVRNIAFELQADEKLKTLILPLEHRKNIYLIFKEAINNAVKYAAPHLITASLTINGRLIQLKVTDDGIGFDPEQVIKGNGLKNFQVRAKEIQGSLIVDTSEGKGTRILLQCSI